MKYIPLLLGFLLFTSCSDFKENVVEWEVNYPEDNPPDKSIADFGKQLFFDKALSLDNSIACASCHKPELAFADTLRFSKGIRSKHANRNSPSLLNVVYAPHFMSEAQVPSLEMQALVPLQDSNEMGANLKSLIEELKPKYNQLSIDLFNRELDAYVLTRALANYQRTLISYNSPFDSYYYGEDEDAISPEAKNGWRLFNRKFNCTSCHSLPNFTNYSLANNGLYKDYLDEGRYNVTGKFKDKGKFKVPSLRNCSKTYPYMHNGSIKDLRSVIEHYAKGGANHPNQDKRITPFEISENEIKDMLVFLESLNSTLN